MCVYNHTVYEAGQNLTTVTTHIALLGQKIMEVEGSVICEIGTTILEWIKSKPENLKEVFQYYLIHAGAKTATNILPVNFCT